MQIEQLQYLVEIERMGSISSAATNLHVSQSALSKSIARLEKNLSMTLFIRLRTGIIPTESGKQLIEKAKEILGHLQEFSAIAEQYRDATLRQVTLTCVPMFSQILSESLELLMSGYANIRVDITEKNSKEILQDVKNNAVDIGFMVVNPDLETDPSLTYKVLLETNMYVCVSKNSPLVEHKQMYPEDLLDHTIASYNGSMIDRLNYYFSNSEPIRYSIVTTNLESIKRKISQNKVISILSELTIKDHHFLENGDIVTIPLMLNNNTFKMQIASVRLKSNTLTTIPKELLKILERKISTDTNIKDTLISH